MKKQLRISTAILLIFVTTFGMSIEASAAGKVIDTNVVRRADLPDLFASSGVDCFGVQAMAVSRGKNCLYAIKIDGDNANAVLYYFPDISNWERKAAFSIYDAGHANGMTVDTKYIYICAKPNGEEENEIIRISRKYIEDKAALIATEENITVATEILSKRLGDDNYKIMQPMVINPDESQRASKPYVEYTGGFSTITRAESTGKFIIGKKISGVDRTQYNGFTRAEIINGEFVVSSDPDDIFLVKNSVVNSDASRQDIYYRQGYGLFIGRWYGEGDTTSPYYHKANNVILWADIDGTSNETYAGYRCYTPDKIKIYMDNYKVDGITVYEKFEIESMGITSNGNLIATFNVIYTDAYYKKYISGQNENITDRWDGDGVYRINRADGKSYKLSENV